MIRRRVLLCIGCDHYQFLSQLAGAEEDAKNVFGLLSHPGHGDYDSENSILLLSPSCSELDAALTSLFSSDIEIDTVTIFFAGHGAVTRGSYYLCLQESKPQKFSTSAYSMSRLFEIINENKPAQCNIIIDACESGGIVSNLSLLLNPELIGNANSSGISIFATSAANEYSLDTSSGGVGTTQLLRILNGEVSVQTTRAYLDLVEVGRVAASLIEAEAKKFRYADGTLASQTPVVWGLNLFGQSRFAKNPIYNGGHPDSIHSLVSISARSQTGNIISDSSEDIWRLLHESPDALTPRRIYDVLYPILQRVDNDYDISRFLAGIATSLLERTKSSIDSFASASACATFVSLLLEHTGKSGEAEKQILEFAALLQIEITSQFRDLIGHFTSYPHYLAHDGLSDFYYLPIRISNILGYGGALLLLGHYLGNLSHEVKNTVAEVFEFIADHYSSCCFAISDQQSPHILSALLSLHLCSLSDLGERLFGLYVSQFIRDKAIVSRAYLPPEDAYSFVSLKHNGSLTAAHNLAANPNETLSVILMMAHIYNMSDTVDPYLIDIDHTSHLVFIPDNHRHFSRDLVEEGRNHNFQVGHGIWSVNDFIERWSNSCLPQLSSDSSIMSPSVVLAALLSSIIFPDRTPWFLLTTPADKAFGR